MITIPDQLALELAAASLKLAESEAQLPGSLFGILTSGYAPDDDDPAWPSKSGQAD